MYGNGVPLAGVESTLNLVPLAPHGVPRAPGWLCVAYDPRAVPAHGVSVGLRHAVLLGRSVVKSRNHLVSDLCPADKSHFTHSRGTPANADAASPPTHDIETLIAPTQTTHVPAPPKQKRPYVEELS